MLPGKTLLLNKFCLNARRPWGHRSFVWEEFRRPIYIYVVECAAHFGPKAVALANDTLTNPFSFHYVERYNFRTIGLLGLIAVLEIPSCDRWVYEIKHGRVRNCNFNSMCGSVLRHCFFDGLGSDICVVIFSMASRCLWVFRTSSQGCPPKVVFPHQSVRAIYWAVVRQQDPHGGALVLGSVVDGERRPDGGWSRWGMVAPSTSEWDVAGYCKVDQLTVAAQVSQRGDDERLDGTNQQTEPTQQTMLGIKQCTHVT